ncbi:uncharacterized protein CEXT_252361 [Caerostris extrusa]|uniref:LRRCT domain-containing protein n=1 Tax=Caerostris extrusa TaxID=172846 RepID=A0AAV4QF75_CAEEX|nr:uncharacterized protein CEXT_252361 [Caerostris extrusa]
MNSLTDLHLEGNRIATLGSKIHALTQLRILSISNNRIRTISTNQIPPRLMHLYLAGNPFSATARCYLLFLQFLNSSEELTIDEDLCTPSLNGNAHASPPARCPAPCRCSCSIDNFILVDCSSTGLTHLPPLFKRAGRDQEGLNLSNNKIQSLEEARLPSRMRFLFLDHNLMQKPPVFFLKSLKFLTRVTLSNNPWTCDCAALDFKKWVVSKSVLVLDVNETRCGPDMPNSTVVAERAIWLLPDLELCPDYTALYIYIVCGVLSKFVVGGGRRNNRLDTIQDEREGVALLTRSDLGQGEGHRQGQGVRRIHLLQLQRSRPRHSGANRGGRREGPGYQVVPSLQTLPPG